MQQTSPRVSSVILFGLKDGLALDLQRQLLTQGVAVHSSSQSTLDECVRLFEQTHAGVVFCASDPDCYQALLGLIKKEKLALHLIVVSRQPETSDWLKALEAGATDYCAPPFDIRQIQWMLDGAAKPKTFAA